MKRKKQKLHLVANGDLRLAANQVCWPAQEETEKLFTAAVEAQGWKVVREHFYDQAKGHGFIDSQKMGIRVFRHIPKDEPVVVVESVWQYSQHILPGLSAHRGPILTVANWSGTWPGLVGMLNLNGSLTKMGVKYGTLWSENFADDFFLNGLSAWLKNGKVQHDTSHVKRYTTLNKPAKPTLLGRGLARELKREQAIMGVFDEGCMGMHNAIIPDELLNATGVFKERMSQSALYAEMLTVRTEEAQAIYDWYLAKGIKFRTGTDEATELTKGQIFNQCAMYIAAVRLADDFGCACIGIQYQQGLKDLCAASDLVEGTLNNSDRPPVKSRDGLRVLFDGKPVTHFNEVDECAGLDGLITQRVQEALSQPPENTLHDLRWGDWDQSKTTDKYVWVFEISGSAPPAHFANGWAEAEGFRQPPMYFPLGGSTLSGISRPGDIVWSRIFIQDSKLKADIGLGQAIALPAEETERRWKATTWQWPVMHAVLPGITRDQMMARHKANHIQVVYGTDREGAVRTFWTKAAMFQAMGLEVSVCGDMPTTQ